MAKHILKLLLKLILTGLALFVVFRQIDASATWREMQSADWRYMLLAFLFFVFSKIFSSFRLNVFLKDLGIQVPTAENLKLYGIGMFYNLFLPGGIGGDGYKVYLLNKHYKAPVKDLFAAILLDRINGLGLLIFLMFALLFILGDSFHLGWKVWGLTGLLAVPLAFYVNMRLFFMRFMSSISITLVYSFLVQLLQLVCAYFILLGLGITAQVMEYLLVFLLSSIVAVIPLTVGGVGARELVFAFSHDYMGIDENSAVAFSLLFFVITVAASLVGVFLKFNPENKPLN